MSGKNPLGVSKEPQSYEGQNIIVPFGGFQVIKAKRNPSTTDLKYPLTSLWVNTSGNTVYVLTSVSAGSATWTEVDNSGGGLLPVANGGTGATTFTAHGVLVGEGTSAVVATAVGTTGQVLTGSSAADPAFAALGTNSGLTAHGVLLGENNSAIVATAAGSTGQVLIGSTGADPAFGALGVNSGLTAHGVLLAENNSAFVATAAGSTGQALLGSTGADPAFANLVTVNVVDVTGTSQAMAINTTYIADNAALVVFTLPTTAVQGSIIKVVGNGAGGWQIQQNAGQSIKSNGLTTTTGTSGSLSSTNRFNTIEIFATVGGASTIWVVSEGNGTYTFV